MAPKVQDKEQIFFNERVWLNSKTSASTGSIVCFDGILNSWDGMYRSMFVEIGDCKGKVRLHNSYTETKEEFIDKLEYLAETLKTFINHLKEDKHD